VKFWYEAKIFSLVKLICYAYTLTFLTLIEPVLASSAVVFKSII